MITQKFHSWSFAIIWADVFMCLAHDEGERRMWDTFGQSVFEYDIDWKGEKNYETSPKLRCACVWEAKY